MKFPTLHCRCKNNHTWGSLIPKYWFALSDLQCPHCYEPAKEMKAGDYKNIEEIKQEQKT